MGVWIKEYELKVSVAQAAESNVPPGQDASLSQANSPARLVPIIPMGGER